MFGIRFPKDINEALKLDDEDSNNNYWYDAIVKEMESVRIAFTARDDISV